MGRGFVAIGIYHGKTSINLGTLWRSAHAFGAELLFTVGRRYERCEASDTTHARRHVPLLHFTSVDDLRAHLPWSTPLIGIELIEAATPIRAFAHPERAAYLLGAEDHGLSPEVLACCHATLVLPGRYCLNVASAGTIVLYDRWLRGVMPYGSRPPKRSALTLQEA
jgi:tRNA G18 (ribose-2'-O)-methylase SpoU